MYNQPRRSNINAGLLALFLLAGVPGLEARDEQLPSELVGVDITPRIGEKVNLDLQFTAENGYQVPLRQFFGKGKPVILNFVYYRCPMLCNLVLNGQTAALRDLAWTAGKEFDIVTISIAPDETFDLAQAKKKFYLETYGRPEAASGWHFLTDYQGNTRRLADQIGFKYRWDAKTEQWAHTAAIMLMTPDGRISQYLYGVRFKDRDLRLGLTEASEGKLGTLADKLILFCFHYDPEAKGYVPFARNLMKVAGGLMVLVMGITISVLFRRERNPAVPTGVATVK
ncbi:MAG TPA: SCO family protein [Bryobacteraceae bacterium]|nr:SCO family protein [Bryobacteraceae bacterium]